METLSCHSNKHKNNIFVEAIVRNNSAKFQLYPLNSFWGVDFLIFFSKIYPLCCHGNQSNSAIWTKFIWIVEDYSRNISVKKIYKLPYQPEFLSDSNKKQYYSFPLPIDAIIMWNMAIIGFMASEVMSFENVDDGQTDDGCLPIL